MGVRRSGPFRQLTIDDGNALVQAAIHSFGLIMIVDYLVKDALRAGHLVVQI